MIEKILNSNIYNNKAFLNTLKFASEKSAVYTTGTSLLLASIARPLSILSAPKTDKEDKKLSCIKSLISSTTGFLFMLLASNPFSRAVKNIDKNPKQYLSEETIKKLSGNLNNVTSSKSYNLITQLFKLGLAFLMAYPKALVNNAVISKVVNKKDAEKENKKEINFTSGFEKIIAKTINNKKVQDFALKAQNTNYTRNFIALGDIFSTLAFTTITAKNKKLDTHKKKILNYNATISTALCLLFGFSADKLTQKPMDKFLNKLSSINSNSPDLAKYIEGSKIIKTSLIFGIVYYTLIPAISTFISSKLASKTENKL